MRRVGEKIQRWYRSLEGKYLRPGYEPSVPESITIELSNRCNLRCTCCPHGVAAEQMRPTGTMSPEVFRQVLDHLDAPFKHAYLHLHGEPFLNPHIADFASQLISRGVAVHLYSNCTAVTEKHIEALLPLKRLSVTFSADLLEKAYYEGLRAGARYEDTLARLDRIDGLFARYNRYYGLTVIVDSSWSVRTDELATCCERLYRRYPHLNGILLGSKFPWPGLPQTGDCAGRLANHSHRCRRAFEGLHVFWNGEVSMCSFDYKGECVVGSLLENRYTELLNHPAARRFRMLHWRHRDEELPLCRDCLLDRYVPGSVALHRASFLKNSHDENHRLIQSFFPF